jgi:carbon monoxide dehydrogenase subunit G
VGCRHTCRGGLVASVGSRLMESTTKSKVREIVENIKTALEGKKRK